MKLLLVSNMYPSKKYPHYGVFVENTEKVLRRMPGITIGKAVLAKHDGKAAKLWGYLTFYAKTVLMGVFGGYDVLYCHFISHAALPLLVIRALNRKIRLVLNAHGNDVVADEPKDHKWVALSHKAVPLAHRIIVPSTYFRDVMCRDFGVAQENILVYPSGGINTQVFCPQNRDALLGKYGLDSSKRYIGYISRIETDKGWDTFLQMAAALKEREGLGFIVVGDGAQRAQFDAMAQELGLAGKLHRYPLLSQSDIAEVYNILDVFCFPTRRKSESLGLVGLEAMACGSTVVASNAGGPSSYMEDGINGFMFRQDSADDLTRQVLAALSMDAAGKAHLQAGMAKTVTQYSKETADGILLEDFETLRRNLNEKSAGAD